MKTTIMENLEKIVAIFGAIVVSLSSLIAYWVQRKKDKEDAGVKRASETKINAESTKILVDTATDSAKDLIEQYRTLSIESITSARECKRRMDEIMDRLDIVMLSNSELKVMNKDLKLQNDELLRNNSEVKLQNEELIRNNEKLHLEMQELKEIINCLSDQLEEAGIVPKLNRKKDKQLMEEE